MFCFFIFRAKNRKNKIICVDVIIVAQIGLKVEGSLLETGFTILMLVKNVLRII
jgi:hypothetical protein